MKQAAPAIAAAALWGWFASCGGGVLGGNPGNGANGMPGPGNSTGGATGNAQGSAGRDGGGSLPGLGGDIWVPPPGGSGPAGSGPAGSGGRGGVSGPGGRGPGGEFGTGGMWFPCVPPPPPVCGASCGNGKIDGCVRSPTPGCPLMNLIEQCDAADFGYDSCQARGYGSGTLSCNSDCTLGADTCSPCVIQGLVAACGPGPAMSPYVGPHSMAATDSEVALVVIEYDEYGTQSLLFERLSSGLKVLGTTTIDDGNQVGVPESIIQGTALAPLPSGGWTIAVCAEPDIYFLTLDAAGRERGRVVITPSVDQDTFCSAQVPVLAARPDGGPLMLWRTETGVRMSFIAADGLSASSPQTIVAGDVGLAWENVAAAWVGNEFAVAVPFQIDPYGPRGLRLLGVAPDGMARLVDDYLTGEFDSFASVAGGPDARDVRVVYSGAPPGGDLSTNYGLVWWRPDPAAPAPSALIGLAPEFFGPSPAVAFGDDTVVLAVRSYGDGQGIVRVASDGRIVSQYREVFRTPSGYSGPAAMVRRGPEIVVSLISYGRMYLARFTP